MSEIHIVVVGAGVSGLTTALLLSKNPMYKITVAAKHMPGDSSIEYASPYAGANYLPVSQAGSSAAEHDRNTWPELERLARDHPESGIHFQDTVIYSNKAQAATNELHKLEPWWKDTLPNVWHPSTITVSTLHTWSSSIPKRNAILFGIQISYQFQFKSLPADKLKGFDHATSFTSVCINTAIYLPYLLSRCLKAGVIFQRAIFKHISEAANAHTSGQRANLVVNCTGLSAGKLGGVEDIDMTPARGQTVLVRNETEFMYATSKTEDGDEEMLYVMQRAAGGGTLLGGCYQKGNWESQVDPNLAIRIMKRAVDFCPSLTRGKGIEHLDVIRHGVGLRPLRITGARVEREMIDGIWVVHDYGHGGFGYQASYGCSQVVVKLVEEALALK